MLLQLLPRDITKHWEGLSEAISKSLPPTTSVSRDRMSIILQSLISETMQCWVLCEPSVEKKVSELFAVATTELVKETGSATRNLLIYSLFGLRAVSDDQWREGFETLRKFAQSRDCENIIAYTDNPAVVSLAKKFGGDVSTTLIVIGVK